MQMVMPRFIELQLTEPISAQLQSAHFEFPSTCKIWLAGEFRFFTLVFDDVELVSSLGRLLFR